MTSLAHSTGRLLVLLVAGGAVAAALAGETTRVSVDSSGNGANAISTNVAISGSGRFVAFGSAASNLVPGDTNDTRDIFVHDRKKGITTRVSVSSTGVQADKHCYSPAISANGRYVVFDSGATTLVDGDDNGKSDVFLHDRKTGKTTRVSVDSAGNQADGHSIAATISANGRLIAFESEATDLVAGDGNKTYDVFLHDRKKGTTERVSVDSTGAEAARGGIAGFLSANGRYLAFESNSSDLVEGDGNGYHDVFVRDLRKRTTTRVSLGADGSEANLYCGAASLSGTGRYVAFVSTASNLTDGDDNEVSDVFLRDVKKGTTVRLSVSSDGARGDAGSWDPEISANGRYVAFRSTATNLVDGDTNETQDVFVRDWKKGVTTRESVGTSGEQGDGAAGERVLSANGRFIAFTSRATNLVDGDDNDTYDVFVHDRKQRKK